MTPSDYQAQYRAKMDTWADTVCAGAAFLMLEDTSMICNMGGFHNQMERIEGVAIVTCATAYDHPGLQETLILIFHESLYFGAELEHSLICLNQLWDSRLIVDLCPRQYSKG